MPSARRISGRGEGTLRTARRSASISSLDSRSVILLTDAGLAFITRHAQCSRVLEPTPSIAPSLHPSVSPSPSLPLAPSPSPSLCPILPHYDTETRELSVAEVVILRLPVQGRNLTTVLTTLEQSGWKSRVVKPLHGRPGGNDPHHLAIAAYKLNVRQPLIEFHADDGAFRWNWRKNVDRKVIEE